MTDGDDDFVANSRDHNARWRGWLAQELESLGNHGVRVVPSATNFLLVLFEGEVSAETVYNRLMDAGYIVRWPWVSVAGNRMPFPGSMTNSSPSMTAIALPWRTTWSCSFGCEWSFPSVPAGKYM